MDMQTSWTASTSAETPSATDESEQQLQEAVLIAESGSIRPQNAKHLIHCLTIIGQVEGHYILPAENKTTKYEHIIPALIAIEQDRSIEGLMILLNTVGGDVEAGLANPDRFSGTGRRPFHRSAASSECEAVFYCAFGNDDDSPRPNKWTGCRRAADICLF